MQGKQQKYIALIGDLIDSKKIVDRAPLQQKLANKLKSISTDNDALASPFTITLGDEFQAVFHSGAKLIQSLLEIRAVLHPITCRFSIGIGELSTEINTEQAIGMDGPAFHIARDAIEQMKGHQKQLSITGLDSDTNDLIQPIADLLWASTTKWRKERLQILLGLLKNKQEIELANMLKISERSIYKNIKDAQLKKWVELIRNSEAYFTQHLESSK